MSADQIRAAAETLRKRAVAAHAGPWEAYPDGLVWDTVHRPGDPVSGSTELDDADYIATMHPGVGAALADWLDVVAQRADEIADSANHNAARLLSICRSTIDGYVHAEDIARQINRHAA